MGAVARVISLVALRGVMVTWRIDSSQIPRGVVDGSGNKKKKGKGKDINWLCLGWRRTGPYTNK